MRILIVEDDAKISSFIAKGFKESGFNVDVCGDGESGLNRALTNEYDAAVIDLMLPRLDV
jgi:two-component system OmpR family response regulator